MDEPTVEALRSNFNEEAVIRLKKLEYDHKAVRLGLQGTLWGAWASLITLLAIVLIPVYLGRPVLSGYQIVWAITAFVVPIVTYGAFIFKSALNVLATVARTGGSGELEVGPNTEGEAPPLA